jgi:outer membrane murein-binding lipoprotein Lpp
VRLLLLGAAAAVLVAGCQENDPGEMTSQQYRSLAAQQSTLSVDDVTAKGAVRSAKLAKAWSDGGGAAPAAGLDCLYARTTFKTRDRGVARFCFDDQGTAVSVERNRSDLPDPAY